MGVRCWSEAPRLEVLAGGLTKARRRQWGVPESVVRPMGDAGLTWAHGSPVAWGATRRATALRVLTHRAEAPTPPIPEWELGGPGRAAGRGGAAG